MKIVTYNKKTGNFLSIIDFSGDDTSHIETDTIGFIKWSSNINFELNYCKDGELLERPPKPFRIAQWDGEKWYNPKTIEQQWDTIRHERDNLLLKCDWTQLPDVPLTTKELWITYRQELRDITNQTDPFNIVWPEPPQ